MRTIVRTDSSVRSATGDRPIVSVTSDVRSAVPLAAGERRPSWLDRPSYLERLDRLDRLSRS